MNLLSPEQITFTQKSNPDVSQGPLNAVFEGIRVSVTNTLCEIVQRITLHPVKVAESNFHATTATASKETKRVIRQAPRVA
jgi:hypothetical protein